MDRLYRRLIILAFSALLVWQSGYTLPTQVAFRSFTPVVTSAVPDAPSDVPWGG